MVKEKPVISEKDVEHLSELSKIELSKKDAANLKNQLNEILEYFKMINEVDTSDIPPTYNVHDLSNIFREDTPQSPDADILLGNASQVKERSIKAPRMTRK